MKYYMSNNKQESGNSTYYTQLAGGITYVSGELLQLHSNASGANKLWEEGVIFNPLKYYAKYAIENPRNYDWLTGHLSDFGFALFLTSLAMNVGKKIKNKFLKTALNLAPVTSMILYESVIDNTDSQK